MIQILTQPVTFEEFAEWKPENRRYELHDGGIVEIAQPPGKHEEVLGFLVSELTLKFVSLNLPYLIPKQALVKSSENDSAYLPDILILNETNLASEPLWEKFSTVTQGASIPLVHPDCANISARAKHSRLYPINYRRDFQRECFAPTKMGWCRWHGCISLWQIYL